MRRGIEYDFKNPISPKYFIRKNDQERTEYVRKKHITLFVTEVTLDIGQLGEDAVDFMYKVFIDKIGNKDYNYDKTLKLFI